MGREEELDYLRELLEKLEKAKATLAYSFDICSSIGIKSIYDAEEQDRFESFTAKFARLSDLIIKQAIKLMDALDLDEPSQTVRDAINRAEKKGLIRSSSQFVEIRKLRNLIAHEYAASDEDISSIYASTLRCSPLLFDSVNRIVSYAGKFI